MKTISQQIEERQKERRRAHIARASGIILIVCLLVIAALVFAAAFLKTARIVADAQATAYCEGDVCGGPSW